MRTRSINGNLKAKAFRIKEACLYPQLAEVSLVDGQIQNKKDAKKFVAAQKAKFGKRLPLSPMSQGLYDARDTVDEAGV